jgi:hypothetical protein
VHHDRIQSRGLPDGSALSRSSHRAYRH